MHESWAIPAKTFLVGEYAALKDQAAILLTTTPCFELRPSPQPGLQGIHPESPAGRWWAQAKVRDQGFIWVDPYQGLGGLGASTAQFLSVYQACASLGHQTVCPQQVLQDYWELSTHQGGQRPSGYDLMAQGSQGCVYLNRRTNTTQNYAWPFADLGFILVHSRQKLATHHHLKTLVLTDITDELSELVEYAHAAFKNQSSYHLVEAVKAYHQILTQQGWVADHSLACIQRLYQETQALAIKGCGAMGADVLLLLVRQSQMTAEIERLTQAGWQILANHNQVYAANP